MRSNWVIKDQKKDIEWKRLSLSWDSLDIIVEFSRNLFLEACYLYYKVFISTKVIYYGEYKVIYKLTDWFVW